MTTSRTEPERTEPEPSDAVDGVEIDRTEGRESTGRRSVRIPHQPGLDGLRGIAVAAVVVFHAGPPTWLPGGFLGVSLFFTLSGYLITTLVLAEVRRDRSLGVAAFWARRVRRLIPALLLLTFGVAVLARFVDFGRGIRVDIIGALTYTTNWIEMARGQAYGDLFRAPSPLVHLWSLAIEEQFYLVLPPVAWLLARRAPWRLRRNLGIGAGVVVVAGLVATRLFDDPTSAYYSTISRAPEIAIGALLACRTHVSSDRAPRWLTGATFAGLAATVALWHTTHVSDGWISSGGLVLFACISATLVRGASRPGPAATALSWAPLRGLGLISYGLYLYHWPLVVWLSPPRVDWAPVPRFLVIVGLALALSIASYALVERRFRRGWPGTPSGQVISLGLAALALTLVVSLLVAPPGQADGGDGATAQPAPAVVDPSAAAEDTTPAATGPTRVAMVGDSVPAWLIRDGGSALDPEKISLINGTLAACDGAEGTPVARSRTGAEVPIPEGCTGWKAQYPPFFERDADLAVLMIGGHAVLDRQIEGEFRGPCDPVAADWYEADVRARLRYLGEQASNVVLVLPTWAEDLSEWIYTDDHVERMDCVRASLATVAQQTGAEVVDFGEYVCPTGPGQCLPLRRKDGMHLDPPNAPKALVWILDHALVATRLAREGTVAVEPSISATDGSTPSAPDDTSTSGSPGATTSAVPAGVDQQPSED